MSSSVSLLPNLSATSDLTVSATSAARDPIFSARCYLKIVMHAFRYPHATVNGVLIMEKKGKSNKQNRFVDAIPLFHSGHGLAPMMEIALTQISEYFSKDSNFVIGGYYQVNEHFHEHPYPTPTVFAEKIADKILETNSDSILLMVSNYDLAAAIDDVDKLKIPFYMYQNVDGKWKLPSNPNSKNFSLEGQSDIFELVKLLVFKQQQHLNIIDFDSHLENIKNDWRNIKLNELIDEWINQK